MEVARRTYKKCFFQSVEKDVEGEQAKVVEALLNSSQRVRKNGLYFEVAGLNWTNHQERSFHTVFSNRYAGDLGWRRNIKITKNKNRNE